MGWTELRRIVEISCVDFIVVEVEIELLKYVKMTDLWRVIVRFQVSSFNEVQMLCTESKWNIYGNISEIYSIWMAVAESTERG